MSRKLAFGVGINDVNYIVRPIIDGKEICCPYYRTWRSMLRRCYCPHYQRASPTYKGCCVTEKWFPLSSFKAWMETQDWQNKQLDKDFLGDGKLYSPDTCCFVPQWLNNLFTGGTRGKWPIGVSWHKRDQKFSAYIKINGRLKHLGSFNGPQEAHQTYLVAKRDYVIAKMADYPDLRVKKAVLALVT